jgi:hypothetical protein
MSHGSGGRHASDLKILMPVSNFCKYLSTLPLYFKIKAHSLSLSRNVAQFGSMHALPPRLHAVGL